MQQWYLIHSSDETLKNPISTYLQKCIWVLFCDMKSMLSKWDIDIVPLSWLASKHITIYLHLIISAYFTFAHSIGQVFQQSSQISPFVAACLLHLLTYFKWLLKLNDWIMFVLTTIHTCYSKALVTRQEIIFLSLAFPFINVVVTKHSATTKL